MEPLNSRYTDLFNAWCENPEGNAAFAALVASGEISAGMLSELMKNRWQQLQQQDSNFFTESDSAQLLARIREQMQVSSAPVHRINRNSINWRRMAVAASILLVLGLGSYFVFFRPSDLSPPIATIPANDITAPVINKARITTAEGRIIYLDSTASEQLLVSDGVQARKTADGRIVYEGRPGSSHTVTTGYNTIDNPRGSPVVQLQLVDGSRVWLNAGSSVTYPVAFTGNERQVTMTGEAYFEVAHDASKPFYVSTGDVRVQVLGTHFNVKAYDDEALIHVTLLEGSVKVDRGAAHQLLKPGQQAQVGTNMILLSTAVDIEQVMAWKNGMFRFRNTNITEIMREVARWYDVDVRYEGGRFEELNFGGSVPRQAKISELLERLETTKSVRFQVEGRRVTVKPY